MINSAEELEATISAIEDLHDACAQLEQEYQELPWWAVFRRLRNLKERDLVLNACGPHWAKLQGVLPDDIKRQLHSSIEVFK